MISDRVNVSGGCYGVVVEHVHSLPEPTQRRLVYLVSRDGSNEPGLYVAVSIEADADAGQWHAICPDSLVPLAK